MPHKVFWSEPTEFVELSLRRYHSSPSMGDLPCPGVPGKYSYHNALYDIGKHPVKWSKRDRGNKKHWYLAAREDEVAKDDHRWPVHCDKCDYKFVDGDMKQVFQEQIYRNIETNEEFSKRKAPIGAMYDAWWLSHERYAGPDGISLMVTLPGGGEWNVDSRASNCDSPCKNCGAPYNAHKSERCAGYEDMKNDDPKFWDHYYKDARPHKCWIRHGDPKTGIITVDKNGVTCGAGAGSIRQAGYHGFLQNGYLTDG